MHKRPKYLLAWIPKTISMGIKTTINVHNETTITNREIFPFDDVKKG